MLRSLPRLRPTEKLNFEVTILEFSLCPLTHRDPLITVWSSHPVSASATVVPTEIPIALASAVEKSQRPPLSVITSSIGILGSVAPVVCVDGHTLSPTCAGSTLVPYQPSRGRAALATLQPLGSNARPGELSQGLAGAQGHHQETCYPHAKCVHVSRKEDETRNILGMRGFWENKVKD